METSPLYRTLFDQAPLAVAWLAYAAIHSISASTACKNYLKWRAPKFVASYRLIYNALALILLAPILWLALRLPGPQLWVWSGVAVLALLSFLRYGSGYDLREFLGLSANRAAGPARLVISDWHRFVRHPWYSLGLILIWTRDMTAAGLVSALAITLYFWIGSRFEEAKLCAEFGQRYRDYQSQVGGLLPRPWRILSKAEAQRLAG
jgi:methanethiol S-methyltransferase